MCYWIVLLQPKTICKARACFYVPILGQDSILSMIFVSFLHHSLMLKNPIIHIGTRPPSYFTPTNTNFR